MAGKRGESTRHARPPGFSVVAVCVQAELSAMHPHRGPSTIAENSAVT